jgi:hypothetical protein
MKAYFLQNVIDGQAVTIETFASRDARRDFIGALEAADIWRRQPKAGYLRVIDSNGEIVWSDGDI